MLVLTRKSKETIRIGHDISITVIEIKGNSVRIGIDAPDNIRIFRQDLYERIKEENLKASGLRADEFDKITKVLGVSK